MAECPICVEKMVKTKHKPNSEVKCNSCSFSCCKSCCKKYLLDLYDEVQCMNCHKNWSQQFVMENLSKTFIKTDYKLHRKEILFEREKSRLSSSVKLAEKIKNKKEYESKLKILIEEFSYLLKNNQTTDVIKKKRSEIMNVRISLMKLDSDEKKKENEETEIIHQNCPVDDCRGFICNGWKCRICDVKVCSKCRVIKEDDHVCKDEDLSTARMLQEKTKPCPNCASLIFKIDGCNQMFCVSCHTAFDWISLKIIRGRIHNPHYHEYLMKNNQVIDPSIPVDCNQFHLDFQIIRQVTQSSIANDLNESMNTIHFDLASSFGFGPDTFIENIYSKILYTCLGAFFHFSDEEIPHYSSSSKAFEDLRVDYILGNLDEENWKRKIVYYDKKEFKNQEIRDIMEMFTNILHDQLQKIVLSHVNKECGKIIESLEEIIRIRRHANDSFQSLKKIYDNRMPKITKSLRVKRFYY